MVIRDDSPRNTMKTATKSLHDQLEYLVKATARSEPEIVAEALAAGMTELFRRHATEDYLAGRLTRARAIASLGKQVVAELDYARKSVEKDVKWGLKGA